MLLLSAAHLPQGSLISVHISVADHIRWFLAMTIFSAGACLGAGYVLIDRNLLWEMAGSVVSLHTHR